MSLYMTCALQLQDYDDLTNKVLARKSRNRMNNVSVENITDDKGGKLHVFPGKVGPDYKLRLTFRSQDSSPTICW